MGKDFKKKRDAKHFYREKQKQQKLSEELQGGLQGFLFSCSPINEKRCVKEVLNLLNEWLERMYPDLDIPQILEQARLQKKQAEAKKEQLESENGKKDGEKGDQPPKEEQDQKQEASQKEEEKKECQDQNSVSAHSNLEREMREEARQLRHERIFFVFQTGTQGIVFIKLLAEMQAHVDVMEMGRQILEEAQRECKTRFVCRFIPVKLLCKAGKFEEFKEMAAPILQDFFKARKEEVQEAKQSSPQEEHEEEEEKKEVGDKGITWCLEFKKKNNEAVQKQDVLDFIFKTIDGHTNRVDFKNAQAHILCEIYRQVLVFSILPKFRELKKYNLQQLSTKQQPQQANAQDGSHSPAPAEVFKNPQQAEEEESSGSGEDDIQLI